MIQAIKDKVNEIIVMLENMVKDVKGFFVKYKYFVIGAGVLLALGAIALLAI